MQNRSRSLAYQYYRWIVDLYHGVVHTRVAIDQVLNTTTLSDLAMIFQHSEGVSEPIFLVIFLNNAASSITPHRRV